jgi:hypothetical protein
MTEVTPIGSTGGANLRGSTLREFALWRFFQLLDEYRKARKDLNGPGARARLASISIGLHAMKGYVPKRYWPLVRRAFRGED